MARNYLFPAEPTTTTPPFPPEGIPPGGVTGGLAEGPGEIPPETEEGLGEEVGPGVGPAEPPARTGQTTVAWDGGVPYWYVAIRKKETKSPVAKLTVADIEAMTPAERAEVGVPPGWTPYSLDWERKTVAVKQMTVGNQRGLFWVDQLGQPTTGDFGEPVPFGPVKTTFRRPKEKEPKTFTITRDGIRYRINEETGEVVGATPVPEKELTPEEIDIRATKSWEESAAWAKRLQAQRKEAEQAEEARLAPGRARAQIMGWLGGTARPGTQADFLNALRASGTPEASIPMWLRRESPDWELPGGFASVIERARLAGVPVPGTTAPKVTVPQLGAPKGFESLAGMHISATSPLWGRAQELGLAPKTPLGITEAKETAEKELRESEELTATRQPFFAAARRRGRPFLQR